MKPAVLFVHSNAELYGSDYILLLVVQALKDDVRPLVALPAEGPLAERLREAGAEVVLTRESILRRVNFRPARLPGFILNVLRDARALKKLIRKEDVRLVYSNTSAVITGALAARRCRRPHLYHVHEIIQNPPWLARRIARQVLGGSTEVIAVSEAVREQLLRYAQAGDAPVRVIHNGIDPSRFDGGEDVQAVRRELGAGPENILFGVIGRIHPWKGQQYFVEAARLVADVCPRARFAVVGGTFPGYERLVGELQAQVRKLDLAGRVKILPHRDDVPRLMRALDVFVLPSTLPDPLPTVVLEAMAAARPVVATAHGGALEMVLHGETGLLAPPHEASGFSQALLEMTEDANLRHQMGMAGRRRLEEYFHLDRFIADLRECVAGHLPQTERIPLPIPEIQNS
ncbi:MAG: glycosyltransferase family 1 protein [Candidatus Zixiibacteriota bacterium]|nr:MAG: glycosyltransferase family 1 protein [candidate division Zixibacteria bacterium]